MNIKLPEIKTQQKIVDQQESGLLEGTRIEALLPNSEGWQQPTSEEVRLMLKKLEMTGSQASKLVGVNPGTVRK